jgi:hypothetical protein
VFLTIVDSTKYSLGFTSEEITVERQRLSREGKFTLRSLYGSAETRDKLPAFLVFRATPDLKNFNDLHHRFPNGDLNVLSPGERTVNVSTVPAVNVLGKVLLKKDDIPNTSDPAIEKGLRLKIAKKVVGIVGGVR